MINDLKFCYSKMQMITKYMGGKFHLEDIYIKNIYLF